jgi:hypothetical protein
VFAQSSAIEPRIQAETGAGFVAGSVVVADAAAPEDLVFGTNSVTAVLALHVVGATLVTDLAGARKLTSSDLVVAVDRKP